MLRTVLITAWLLSLTAGHTAAANQADAEQGAAIEQQQEERSQNRRVEFQILPN
ncbi:hypothetical protein [Cognatiyoonia sp. IB215182]|uniref:hypothetical protein n=1 Tax=Cognatiyoonia sp. IB215182 TaxID=3097353 RepID=UPI002A0D1605|nr:hypothetical protein [Cognatiyoonia sp. IB215182]MDX8353851.1 hypothetical protein [Cognatiyoonia sp. IB215182]